MLAVNCPPQAPAPGQADFFEREQARVGHLTAGMSADGFVDVLNGDGMAFKLSGSDRAAVENRGREYSGEPAP